jgi:hypothetical protein
MNILDFDPVFVLTITIAIAVSIAIAFAFVKRKSPEVVSPGVVSPEQFIKLLKNHPKKIILIGSAKAGIDDNSFTAIEMIVECFIRAGYMAIVNNGDLLCAGYKCVVDVTILFFQAGCTIFTAQSDAGKAEPGTNWWPKHTFIACFLPTVKNSDGSTTWCALSDEGKMCAPLAFLLGIISWMWQKPILFCVGGGLGSVVEEEKYRKAGCPTYIFKTENVKTSGKSLVEPTENYHVKCIKTGMNGQFYHPRGKCLFGLGCCKFS